MAPSLTLEKDFFSQGIKSLAGIDEVGRGCIAGPVSIGIAVISSEVGNIPKGLNDSKLLSPSKREGLIPEIKTWASDFAVGHSSNKEIDKHGLPNALKLAAARALASLSNIPELIILDGKHNWLKTNPNELFLEAKVAIELGEFARLIEQIKVVTKTKADQACASVAAASVLAKVERDGLLDELAKKVPNYAWQKNKGYASPAHLEAIKLHGPSDYHRISWKPFI